MLRRQFLLAGAAGLLTGAGRRIEITAVKAAAVPLRPASDFGSPKFTSDDDPARRRWFGPFSQLTGAIAVKIETDAGITGYGLGGGGGAAVCIIDHHLRDLLIGANALNVELLWEQIFDSTSFYGRRGVVIMALSGIDLALWDIAGKAAGKPVHALLGGKAGRRIPAYFTSANPERGLKLGFRAFKIPITEGVAQGRASIGRNIERLARIRETIGPEARLMIDCLARWDVAYTIEFARQARGLNLYWIEEPLYPDDVEGYARLCQEVESIHIASGEHEFTHHGFAELIRNRAADILQPDLTWCGGLTPGRKIAALGAQHGLPVIPHRGGSPYGLALIAAAGLPMAESFGTGEGSNELWQAFTAPFADGYYTPSERPGFGVELGDDVLKNFMPALAG